MKLIFENKVAEERERQDKKWGIQDHNPEYWLIIMMEEVGEVAQTLCGESVELDKLEGELIQVAAVCKAMWESGKRQGWIQ